MQKDRTDIGAGTNRLTITTHFTKGTQLHIPDPYLGGDLNPDITVCCESGDTRWLEQTDKYGFRTIDNTEIKPPIDIVFTGCSYCYGTGVNKPYPFIIGDMGYSVVNLGVPGYSLLQSYRRLEQHIAWLQPQIVVHGYIERQLLRCMIWKYMKWTRPFFMLKPTNKNWGLELAIKEPMGPWERVLYALCRRFGINHGWERIYWDNMFERQCISKKMHNCFNKLIPKTTKFWFITLPQLNPKLCLPDGHPNREGHKYIAGLIQKEISL